MSNASEVKYGKGKEGEKEEKLRPYQVKEVWLHSSGWTDYQLAHLTELDSTFRGCVCV